ncbi:DUF3617 family protein [Alteraurantiacibacter buctensis]|uniref:DUF3617 family protein n=1 Tax=Alteraurantiacibacter buctensis TaxID=1503981 RepID=A0A844YWA8_9SPHN|nr:DUF3617 family protein [Alteraurantiacibacter buctensis]
MQLRPRLCLCVPPALLLAALAGCAPDPPDEQEILASAASLPKPQPGLYRSTTRLTAYDLPLASPQEAAAMRERFATLEPAVATSCLTPRQAEEGWVTLVRSLGEGTCQVERFTADGEGMQASVACQAPGGGTSRMAMTGTAGTTSSTMEIRIVQQGEAIPGGEQTISMAIASQRVGDCPAEPPAAPQVGPAPDG